MLLESKSSFFTRVSGSIFSPEKTPEDEKSQSLPKRIIKQGHYKHHQAPFIKKNKSNPPPSRWKQVAHSSGSVQVPVLSRQE